MAWAGAAGQQHHNEPGHAWAWALHCAALLLTWRGRWWQGVAVPRLSAFVNGKAVGLSEIFNLEPANQAASLGKVGVWKARHGREAGMQAAVQGQGCARDGCDDMAGQCWSGIMAGSCLAH